MDTATTNNTPAPPVPPSSTDSKAEQDAVAAIVADLTHTIAHDLDVRIDQKDINPTVPLLDGGLSLDSMVLFELITHIEKRYGVIFDSQNLHSEVFKNLSVLARNIHEMASRAAAQSGAKP